MLSIVSSGEVVAAIVAAHRVTLSAYVLRPGRVFDALELAAKRGTHVCVRLEGQPYGDPDGKLAAQNAAAVNTLRGLGADAQLHDSDGASLTPLHMKAAVVDSAVYLDDRNWPDDGADTILEDTQPRDVLAALHAVTEGAHDRAELATQKGAALRAESALLYQALRARTPVSIQSESFNFGPVYAAITKLRDAGIPVRLLVTARDANAHETLALVRLRNRGVEVRVTQSDEKMALAGSASWMGSANATAGLQDTIDWGLRIRDARITRALARRFEQNWAVARPYADQT